MTELLKALTSVVSPSGSEAAVASLIKKEIGGSVDEITTDALGNLIAHKKGDGKKIMFAAHMDEIGLIVTFIDTDGFLRVSALGGVSADTALGQRVQFACGAVGVVGADGKTDRKAMKLSDLFIDIGASSREEAEALVRVGDACGFCGAFHTAGSRVVSRCLDDRSGCAVLIETAKRANATSRDVYYVFTVQEELGLRGAGPASFSIAPDYGVAVDVTRTGDYPEAPKMAVKLGGGPAVKIKDRSVLAHPVVKNAMLDAAKKAAVPYQLEVLENGGTDTGAIHLSGSGVMSGCISIPTRYIHSPAEMLDLSDLENCVKLAAALIETLPE